MGGENVCRPSVSLNQFCNPHCALLQARIEYVKGIVIRAQRRRRWANASAGNNKGGGGRRAAHKAKGQNVASLFPLCIDLGRRSARAYLNVDNVAALEDGEVLGEAKRTVLAEVTREHVARSTAKTLCGTHDGCEDKEGKKGEERGEIK